MEKICVAVRMRPPVTDPSSDGGNWRWKVEDNRVSLYKPHGTPIASTLSFAFDHVFDECSSNSTVYDLLIKNLITAAVQGFNGTAFAYGQTSSGKTFTMNGSESDPGIINRAVVDIFKMTEQLSDREFLIRVSYMEIYNEEINDLLSVENRKLQIHESLDRGIFVAGLREEIVSTSKHVFDLLQIGEANRHFGETNMNARSSRSHTIFRMVIESKENQSMNSDAIRVSVLNLVDLAGSERIAKTGADGVRLREGKHINKSLMALGNVIYKLSDGAKQKGHVPYRDSKLTRILQPALGGNAKTSIICTIAPEEVHVEETKGTLQFASRAKRITNCAEVNEILTDAALLKRQQMEIEELKQKLQGSMSDELEKEILKLRNEMLQHERVREKLEMELEEERRSQKEREKLILEQNLKIQNLGGLQDGFETPRFEFVSRRGGANAGERRNFSPLPETLGDVADEDTWAKMNNGYVADLDGFEATPNENGELMERIGELERRLKESDEKCRELERTVEVMSRERESEREGRRELEEQVNQFHFLLANRHNAFLAFHKEIRAIINNSL